MINAKTIFFYTYIFYVFLSKSKSNHLGWETCVCREKKPGVLISENNPEGWASVQEQ